MRVVGEIPHKDCKITIFQWNEKYIVKIEQGNLEQSFKINQLDLTSEDEVYEVVNEAFIQNVMNNFNAMHQIFSKALSEVL
ncbi:hypothetical protein [Fulvivirga ligni]|uniref:hypothetical protein n=1 Tax=Fulvivirga ligni TaxID=2904246 RepID=UPI001F41E948|nr:hypothetical protein [Fulvivirga ligni]UII21080.1 hypothetical protein LVD16_24895 [Fulvivirga ligni]